MLSVTCKYAIKSVIYLVLKKEEALFFKTKDIAKDLGIPQSFLGKILQKLAKNNLLESIKGKNGGFSVPDDYKNISLLDIVRLIDGAFIFEKCLFGLNICQNKEHLKQYCPVHEELDPIKEKFYMILKTCTFDKVVIQFKSISDLLKIE